MGTTAVDRMLVGIGTSEVEDAAAAGAAAARVAVEQLDQRRPALVLTYASVRYDLPSLLSAIREVTGGAPVVGASTCGHFTNGRYTPSGTGVAVLAVSAGRYRWGVASGSGLASDPVALGRQLVRSAREAAGPDLPPYGAVLLLANALSGDPQRLLSGMYRITGAGVPVVGGAAADDLKFDGNFVFHNGDVLTDGAVAVWIGGDRPFHVASGHGYRPDTLPMTVTSATGTTVRELAGRPALEVCREHFAAGEARRPAAGEDGAECHATHAFGLIEPDGTQLVRAVTIEDDGVHTAAPLPEYSAVQVVSAGPEDLLGASEQVVRASLAGRDAAVVLAFSCGFRLDSLRARGGEEATRVQAAAGEVPTFGFYTYGEFARTTSVAGFHNATITALAL